MKTVTEESREYAKRITDFRKNILKEIDNDDYHLRHQDSIVDFECGAEWQSNQWRKGLSTSFEQSRRLMELGVRPSTADVKLYFPSWSILCLMDMLPLYLSNTEGWLYMNSVEVTYMETNDFGIREIVSFTVDDEDGYDLYDTIIDMIEWLIKKGYFNKSYLGN